MTNNENVLITPDMKIYDLLKAYPQLEDKLIEIAPVFVKLKNPILRRTITRVTTLKQASIVGKVHIGLLINRLRMEVNQSNKELAEEKNTTSEKPDWIDETKIKIRYDAREDLDAGIHPVNKVIKECIELNEGEIYLLITPFTPAPLLDMLIEKGFSVYSEETENNVVTSYVKK